MTELNVSDVLILGLPHLLPKFDILLVSELSHFWLKSLHELVSTKHMPLRLNLHFGKQGVIVLHRCKVAAQGIIIEVHTITTRRGVIQYPVALVILKHKVLITLTILIWFDLTQNLLGDVEVITVLLKGDLVDSELISCWRSVHFTLFNLRSDCPHALMATEFLRSPNCL
jgi:hypothetical protein